MSSVEFYYNKQYFLLQLLLFFLQFGMNEYVKKSFGKGHKKGTKIYRSEKRIYMRDDWRN